MKIAILADIHANIEAFDAVLEDIDSLGIEMVYSLGDNIGYGPDPEAVIRRLRERNIHSVLGNHEMAVLDPAVIGRFNRAAQEAIRINMKMLSEDSAHFIRSLPSSICGHNAWFVHGFPPNSTNTYLFQVEKETYFKRLSLLPVPVVFIGHTHNLAWFEISDSDVKDHGLPNGVLTMDEGIRHLINAGSVGQPRDGDKAAKYVVWDQALNFVSVRRVPYDARPTIEKIVRAGIPEGYARRLQ